VYGFVLEGQNITHSHCARVFYRQRFKSNF